MGDDPASVLPPAVLRPRIQLDEAVEDGLEPLLVRLLGCSIGRLSFRLSRRRGALTIAYSKQKDLGSLPRFLGR